MCQPCSAVGGRLERLKDSSILACEADNEAFVRISRGVQGRPLCGRIQLLPRFGKEDCENGNHASTSFTATSTTARRSRPTTATQTNAEAPSVAVNSDEPCHEKRLHFWKWMSSATPAIVARRRRDVSGSASAMSRSRKSLTAGWHRITGTSRCKTRRAISTSCVTTLPPIAGS